MKWLLEHDPEGGKLSQYFMDFLTAQSFPDAFDFKSMPLRWQEAQKLMAVLWQRETQVKNQSTQALASLFR